MEKNSFNIQFYCRSSKATKNGYAPLEIAVNVNGVRKFINLPYKCLPSDFNRKRQPKELVDYMAGMRRRINEILADMIARSEPLTTHTLAQYIKTGGIQPYTIKNLFDEYIGILEKRIGTTITKGVYEKYLLVKNLFYTIVDENQDCSTISPSHVKQFKAICESRYMTSTTAGYLRKLKTILTFGIDNGHIKINPFVGTKIVKGSKEIEYLTEAQLSYLENLSIENKSLRNVRDYFLFECYSGISYCDLEGIKAEDIKEDNGVYYIQGRRKKTGKEYTSVLIPKFLNLIEGGKFKFRVIKLQKINAYLHTIEDLYNIPVKLTSHIARHTYATLLANKYRCRMELVASALGDSLKVTVKHYAKFLSETTISEIGNRFRQTD